MRLGLSVLTMLFVGGACVTAVRAEPDWYEHPPAETPDLLFETGYATERETRDAALDKAYLAALRSFGNRISVTVYASFEERSEETSRGGGDKASLRESFRRHVDTVSNHQLIGTDILEEHAEKRWGTWHAWVLVSYPRVQYEKALERVPTLVGSPQRERPADERIPLLVCPMAFGEQSEEQYPELVARYRSSGYGNGIWQKVEDKLYDVGRFQIVTVPSRRVKSVLEQIVGSAVQQKESRLPRRILLCNMNFFEVTTERLRFTTVVRNSEYHVELMLQYYDAEGRYANEIIPAKGEARDKDLLVATDQATDAAIQRLLARLNLEE